MEFNPNTIEKGCHWHFAPQEGGREDGPNDAMMQNFKESPYKSLVREAIQNSLDAVLDRNQPVRVEFTFTSINSRNYTNFFDLKDHIDGCADYFNWQPKAVELYTSMSKYFTQNMSQRGIGYIRISDYNTKGMDYEAGVTSSPFYAFARAAGVSSKIGQESGGSFGFGKFPVEFRVVAQNESGMYYHNLIIHAPHDIPDGDIEIVTIGEQNDDAVNLDYTDNGTVEMNLVHGVSLKEGRNTIKVLFSDNMRHAIKLKAYENK